MRIAFYENQREANALNTDSQRVLPNNRSCNNCHLPVI